MIPGHPDPKTWYGIASLKNYGIVAGSDLMKVTTLNRRLESLEAAAEPPMISTWAEFMADEDHKSDLRPKFSLFLEGLLEKLT